jgi:hypothetical protein
MSKIDSLKEKINILRDDYKNLVIFFMAVITGSYTVFYQVITFKLDLWYSFIGIFGVIINIFILLKITKIKTKIDMYISELEEL